MSHSSAPERASGAVITEWRPEDPAFWAQRGHRIASRNLWISVPCLLLAFCVWMLFSAVAVNLPKVGFTFTTEQLFMLTALPTYPSGHAKPRASWLSAWCELLLVSLQC